jgi:hypothetical protein
MMFSVDKRWNEMTTSIVFRCVLFLAGMNHVFAQQLPFNDPNYRDLYALVDNIGWRLASDKAWVVDDGFMDKYNAKCMVPLNKLRGAGVADTRKIEVHWASPEFKSGPHTLAEIRLSCEHLERLGKIKAFERWATSAMTESKKGGSDVRYARNCIQVYDEIVKAGISPTDRVTDRIASDGSTWSGTVEELRTKWCDAGLTKAQGVVATAEAPYRQELKGDKLKIAITYKSLILPGGMETSDPHKLALSPIWFADFSPVDRHCVDGRQVHNLRRYQFGSDQQLVGKTEQEYCGPAPRSAFQ